MKLCTGRCRDLKALDDVQGNAWIHIVPKGEFPGTVEIPAGYKVPGYDGEIDEDVEVEGVTVFDERVLERMVQQFDGEILIDYEHFSHDRDKATAAAGWGAALRYTPGRDGLELDTEWAAPAKQQIRDKVYRYVSPEFSGAVRFEGGVFKFYPSALTGAGLTNRPKLKTLRPVSANRDTPNNKQTDMKALTLLCSLIGATATDSEEVLEQKTAAFQADLATSKNRATKAAELEAENKKLKADLVEQDLATYADVIDNVEDAKELLSLNRDVAVKTFKGMQAKLGKQPAADGKTVLFVKNRATAPDGAKKLQEGEQADDAAQAKFRAVEARAAVLVAEKKINFTQAFDQAKAELGA